nr:MAG TPA: hypothetical protein [Caudoviricetes sp.]
MSQLYFSICSKYFQYLFFLLTHFSVNRIINTQKNEKRRCSYGYFKYYS